MQMQYSGNLYEYFMRSKTGILFLGCIFLYACNGCHQSLQKNEEQIIKPGIVKMDKATFQKKLELLQKGDSIDRCKQILGQPLSETRLTPKESSNLKGYALLYVVDSLNIELINVKTDAYADIYFNPSKKLTKIVRNNL